MTNQAGKEQSSEGRLAEIGAMARSERLGSLPFLEPSTSAVSRAQYPILERDCQRLFLRDGGETGTRDGRMPVSRRWSPLPRRNAGFIIPDSPRRPRKRFSTSANPAILTSK